MLTFQSGKTVNDCTNGLLIESDQGILVRENMRHELKGAKRMKVHKNAQLFASRIPIRKKWSNEAASYIAAQLQESHHSLSKYAELAFVTATTNLCRHSHTAYLVCSAVAALHLLRALVTYIQPDVSSLLNKLRHRKKLWFVLRDFPMQKAD